MGGEAKQEEEKKEAPKPPSSLVLSMELHCDGCAKKIERSIFRIKGVEVDMGENQVTIKGLVDHQVVCNKILKKTKREPKILSSPQPNIHENIVSSTVELSINMHCEACALLLKKKILQMKGVQTVETELITGKVTVTVTGTVAGDKLVNYIHRRTKKQATIIPSPEPSPEENKDEQNPPEQTNPAEEKKEEDTPPAPAPPSAEEAEKGGTHEDPEKGGEDKNVHVNINPMMIGPYDESMRRMAFYFRPVYVADPIPPAPQLFSDENPNACSIS